MNCLYCGNALAHDANARRIYCSQVCRSAAFRARDALRRDADNAFRTAAADLVMRQTAAVIAGDTATLATIHDEAARLFA